MMSEPRCRNKRQAVGLPYPKSNCDQCGPVIRAGWRCAEESAHATDPAPPAPIASCPFCGNNDLRLERTITEFVLGCRRCQFALTEKYCNDAVDEWFEQKLIERWNTRADKALIGELAEAAHWMMAEICEAWDKAPEDAIPDRFRTALQKARAP